MHVAPPAIQIVVIPTGVTIMLGLYNSPCSWTSIVGPSLPGLTIASKFKIHVCIYTIIFELSYSSLG
jgi:hypothetical protein